MAVLEEFLEPIVELVGVDVEFIAEVGNGDLDGSESGGEGRGDGHHQGPEGPPLPEGAQPLENGLGNVNDGQYLYQFYAQKGKRFVQVTEKATNRQVRLQAAFSEYKKPEKDFQDLDQAINAKSAKLLGISMGEQTPRDLPA